MSNRPRSMDSLLGALNLSESDQEFAGRSVIDDLANNSLSDWSLESVVSTASRPYERELVLYKNILQENFAEGNITIPQAIACYQKPVWRDGTLLYVNDPTSPTQRRVVNYYEYIHSLILQASRDKDWFKCLMQSFWGPVANVFAIMRHNRPFIQIIFPAGWSNTFDDEEYYENVAMFAYLMSRLRPIEGLGPLMDIFGFVLVNYAGKTISEFETTDRANQPTNTEGAGPSDNQARQVQVLHKKASQENVRFDIV
ncbi:hypothetical protein GGS26DRAFT_585869 [Hypomontagnella submonticulosa]|nr:hypothetical protein GGS26DRAFT_585869 [Hypomontagnella submonticulosa]